MVLEMEYIPLFGYVCNGFYRRSIITAYNIRFSDRYIMEDFMFSFEYLTQAKSMGRFPAYIIIIYWTLISPAYRKNGNRSIMKCIA